VSSFPLRGEKKCEIVAPRLLSWQREEIVLEKLSVLSRIVMLPFYPPFRGGGLWLLLGDTPLKCVAGVSVGKGLPFQN